MQLYTRQRRSRVKQPLRQLRDFARITLAPGQRQTVTLRLRDHRSGLVGRHLGGPVVEDATHTVLVGRSARDIRAVGAVTVHTRPAPQQPRPAVPAGGGAR